MAEEAKTTAKAVEVTYDAEGNPTITDVAQPDANDDNQNDDNQDDDNQDDNQDDNNDDSNDDNQDDDSDDNNDDNQDDDSNDDSDDDNQDDDSDEDVDDDADDADDTDEDDDDSDVQENDEDVVDYDELPEAVQAYLDFYEETGGSMQDFAQVNRDFDSLPQDDVIREFLRKKNPYLDSADIDYEMDTRFGITDADSDAEARAKSVAKKKFYGEAMKTLKAEGAKYKADLGSSAALPQQAKEALKFQKDFQAQSAATAKATAVKVDAFVKNTNKVLGKNFKGFEVKVGEDTLTYKPSNVRKTREENLNVNNLLNRFTDKDGNVTDVKGYHKALTFASNPDAIAQHFFDLGKAAQLEDGVKDSKNVQMKPRQTQGGKNTSKQKMKFVDIDPTRSKNAKIKLRNY